MCAPALRRRERRARNRSRPRTAWRCRAWFRPRRGPRRIRGPACATDSALRVKRPPPRPTPAASRPPGAPEWSVRAPSGRRRRARARPAGTSAERKRRAVRATSASTSARTGTAVSAAADGVAARRSATRSQSETSTSWPDRRDCRERARRERASDALVVERPEILARSTTPPHDDEVGALPPSRRDQAQR